MRYYWYSLCFKLSSFKAEWACRAIWHCRVMSGHYTLIIHKHYIHCIVTRHAPAVLAWLLSLKLWKPIDEVVLSASIPIFGCPTVFGSDAICFEIEKNMHIDVRSSRSTTSPCCVLFHQPGKRVVSCLEFRVQPTVCLYVNILISNWIPTLGFMHSRWGNLRWRVQAYHRCHSILQL